MRDRISEMHAEVCKMLGSAIRLDILYSLRGAEKTVSEITWELGLNQANVSQHLAVLRQRGMVSARREGTHIYYGIPNPKIIQACQLMREVLLEQLKEAQVLTATVARAKRR